MRAAVVLGASPTGLAVVRALGSHGVRSYVADFIGGRQAFYSRYRGGKPIIAPTAKQVIERVVEITTDNEQEPPVVFACSDAMVLALVEHRELYDGKLCVHDSIASGLAAKTVDKESFYQLCESAGIATPKTAFPKSADDVFKLGMKFQFPMLLKPILGHLWHHRLRGQKLLVVQSMDELEAHVDRFGDDCDGLMVQELIPGAESNIYVAAIYRGASGNRDVCFVAEKTRQYPPDFGSASLATSRFNETIAELSWRFAEGVDYRGICGTEFKLDPRDGQYKMIEVNPRPTLWFHLASAAGIELIYAAYQDLIGLPMPTLRTQTEGTRWCYWEKDILTWLHHLKHRDVSAISLLSSFSPFNHGAVASLRDPWPFIASPLYYARRLISR